MDASTRQLLKDLQSQAGVPAMDGVFVMNDYDTPMPDTLPQDDDWFDDPEDSDLPPERINIADAARSLRLQLFVFQY